MAEFFLCLPETITMLLIGCTLIQNKKVVFFLINEIFKKIISCSSKWGRGGELTCDHRNVGKQMLVSTPGGRKTCYCKF